MHQSYELLSTEEDTVSNYNYSSDIKNATMESNQIELVEDEKSTTTNTTTISFLHQKLEAIEQELSAMKLENKELREELKQLREEKDNFHFKHFCLENTISKTVLLLNKELEDNAAMYKVYKNSKEKICNFCKKKQSNLKTCSVCYRVYYCDIKCQQQDYPSHSEICKRFAAIQKK